MLPIEDDPQKGPRGRFGRLLEGPNRLFIGRGRGRVGWRRGGERGGRSDPPLWASCEQANRFLGGPAGRLRQRDQRPPSLDPIPQTSQCLRTGQNRIAPTRHDHHVKVSQVRPGQGSDPQNGGWLAVAPLEYVAGPPGRETADRRIPQQQNLWQPQRTRLVASERGPFGDEPTPQGNQLRLGLPGNRRKGGPQRRRILRTAEEEDSVWEPLAVDDDGFRQKTSPKALSQCGEGDSGSRWIPRQCVSDDRLRQEARPVAALAGQTVEGHRRQ